MSKFVVNGLFLTQRPAGVHRFAFELCSAFKRLGLDFVVVTPSKPLYPDYNIDFDVVSYGVLSGHLWEQLELPYFLKRYYNHQILLSFTGLGPIFSRNHISTIHDLAFIENPSWYKWSYVLFYKLFTPIMARFAKHILTVSEFSKGQIIKHLGLSPEKVSVVYNAVSSSLKQSRGAECPIQSKYILAVSSIDPRKNFNRLISAFKKAQLLDYKLVIVGGNANSFAKSGLEVPSDGSVVFTGYLNDDLLASYYSNASLFVYPSLYEGFGIPPLEAMTFSCPVLVSNIEAIKEVCADCAWYCNPYDEDDIANKIKAALVEDCNSENVTKGVQRALVFSWDKSAEKINSLVNI